MVHAKVLVVSAVVLCLVKNTWQLDCFDCTETFANQKGASLSTEYHCGDLPNTAVTTCQTGFDICAKIVEKQGVGYKSINRRCSTKATCDGLNMEGGVTQCYACTGNKCNGAATLTITTVLLALPAVLFAKML